MEGIYHNCNHTHKAIRFVDTQHESYLDGSQAYEQIDEDEYGQGLVSPLGGKKVK